jgi:predicted phosphodiesterase
MLAILYDIHGNSDALKAVLADAKKLKINRFMLGGDYWGPGTEETLSLLRSLPDATWIRGNIERWLKETPDFSASLKESIEQFAKSYPSGEVDKLYNLQIKTEIDGVLYVHGSPKSDVESFAPKPQQDEAKMLLDIHDRTVVFGHSHQQFQRPGPNNTYLVNPGSVGMPLDGDRRAAWAIRTNEGDFEFHRSEYDWHKAADAWRKFARGPAAEWIVKRIENGKDTQPMPA